MSEKGIMLRANENDEWEVFEPYTTIVVETEEDYKILEDAVEKQKPKKPVEKYTRYDFNGEYDGDFCKCPNCKNEIIDGFNLGEDYNYCVHCGQKLDWSEVDENKEDN